MGTFKDHIGDVASTHLTAELIFGITQKERLLHLNLSSGEELPDLFVLIHADEVCPHKDEPDEAPVEHDASNPRVHLGLVVLQDVAVALGNEFGDYLGNFLRLVHFDGTEETQGAHAEAQREFAEGVLVGVPADFVVSQIHEIRPDVPWIEGVLIFFKHLGTHIKEAEVYQYPLRDLSSLLLVSQGAVQE